MQTITLNVPDEPTPSFPILQEVIEFLVQAPSYSQIVEFKVSPESQERLEALLDTNRESILSAQEQAELDVYQQVDHFMILLKARARQALTAAN